MKSLDSWSDLPPDPPLMGQTGGHKIADFIAKYPYHFLTVAICWSHPTQWPTQRCDFLRLYNNLNQAIGLQ